MAERKFAEIPGLGRASFTTVPVKHLTYPGDVSVMATENRIVGPNTLGELWVAVTADYQGPPINKTRVGFTPLRREVTP